MKNIAINYNELFKIFYERPGKPKWETPFDIEDIAKHVGIEIPINQAEKQYILNRLRMAIYQFRDVIANDSNHYLISMKLVDGDLKVYLITRDEDKIEMFTHALIGRKRNLEYRIKELKNYGQGLLQFNHTRKIS